ncbi:MAG: hypothetical protein PHE06_14780 [Lachnospiraceae bacterium]|nr:hypothetical protein [Lachnospiraceae bacterium]
MKFRSMSEANGRMCIHAVQGQMTWEQAENRPLALADDFLWNVRYNGVNERKVVR